MTTSYAVVLLSISTGLSWRANVSQQRWSRLIRTETRAISALEELLRTQNAFLARHDGESDRAARTDRALNYVAVRQLLAAPALAGVELAPLRAAMDRFDRILLDDSELTARGGHADQRLLRDQSAEISRMIQLSIDRQKREVERELPSLDGDSRDLLLTGVGISWIVVILSFAVARLTLAQVVRPIEELSAASERIARGELDARAQTGGDFEVAALGQSFNRMADALTASHAELEKRFGLHLGDLAVVGVVVAPLRGDSHSASGLRFGLKNIDGKSGVIPVVYRGDSPPPLFNVGRNVVVSGSYAHGRLVGNNVLTKCPSKYTTTQPA